MSIISSMRNAQYLLNLVDLSLDLERETIDTPKFSTAVDLQQLILLVNQVGY
jgi:hypothetical protein